MTIITTSVNEVVRLNDFVHIHIQRSGIAFVVDNYQPIREQYYENKENISMQRNDQWQGSIQNL